MTAEATGVKTITVNFNKTIANPDAVKVTVTKGSANRDCKATVDGSKITIAMDTKLMAGTYTVSVEGVDTNAMTADVIVEKNETLTTFEVSPNLTMASKSATDSAVCYYTALNQYGEMMVADQPDVSSSFSSKTTIKRAATASVKGQILIEDIPTVLAIQGTTGTIVLVDKNTGVNVNAKVTVSAAATAAEATVVGTYNTTTSKMENITAGAKVGNYYILLAVKDQYGDEVDVDHFSEVANISLAGGLTGVELYDSTTITNNFTSVTVEGKEYIAIKLDASNIAKAGSYTMTIVNTSRGLLSSGSYDVADSVIANSISIAPKNGVYLECDNEMDYTVLDKDGKEITSYATLKSLVTFDAKSGMSWEKKSDGSAKLLYTPDVDISGTSETASTMGTVIAYVNDATSSNYIVKTFTFTVNKEKKIKSVQGLADGTVTSVAVGETLKIANNKIVYADQYSNKVTKDDEKLYKAVVVSNSATMTSGCSVYIEDKDKAFTTASAGATEFEFKAAKAGTAQVYLKYMDPDKVDKSNNTTTVATASATNYDFKFTVTASDTGNVGAASLKIDSVNSGFAISGSGIALKKDQIEVVGIIGGSKTKIPTTQYVIKDIKNNSFTEAEKNAGTTTKTATVTVQVTTWDANNNPTETEISADYTVSTEKAKVFKIVGVSGGAIDVTSKAAVTNGAIQDLFKFEDQYNQNQSKGVTAGAIVGSGKVATNVSYEINVLDAASTDDFRVSGNGTNDATVTFYKSSDYKVKVTATVNGQSKSVTVTMKVK